MTNRWERIESSINAKCDVTTELGRVDCAASERLTKKEVHDG